MHFILWIWHSLKIKQRIFSYTFSFFFLQSRSTLHWNDKWNSQFLFFFLLSRSFWRRKCCWIYYFFHLPASLISLAVFLYRHRFKSQINFNYHTVKRHLQHPKILIRFARNAVVLWNDTENVIVCLTWFALSLFDDVKRFYLHDFVHSVEQMLYTLSIPICEGEIEEYIAYMLLNISLLLPFTQFM